MLTKLRARAIDLGARDMRWQVRLSAREIALEPEDIEHFELGSEDHEAEIFLDRVAQIPRGELHQFHAAGHESVR
jgi:hypothetical protein